MTENEFSPRRVLTVHLEPDGKTLNLPKAGATGAVLKRLGFFSDQVLVIRGDTLLTPDRPLYLGEEIIIRTIGSRG